MTEGIRVRGEMKREKVSFPLLFLFLSLVFFFVFPLDGPLLSVRHFPLTTTVFQFVVEPRVNCYENIVPL